MDSLVTYVKKRILNVFDIKESEPNGRMILTKCTLYVDGVPKKQLKLLPLEQSPKEYLADICDDVTIIIEYCYSKNKTIFYKYRYDTDETISFPLIKKSKCCDQHAIRVYAWITQQVPKNISKLWQEWQGPQYNFHDTMVPAFHVADTEPSESQIFFFIMLNDGSRVVIDTFCNKQIGWPMDGLRECRNEEWILIEKLSEMTLEQCQSFFSQLYTVGEDSVDSESETEISISDSE